MTESRSSERWLSLLGNVLGSVGTISALLFYFGYASSRAKYEYFGVDVDTVGLDTREFLMRSPQPLLVPVVVLGILALLAVWLHTMVSRGSDGQPGDSVGRRTASRLLRRGVVAAKVVGAGALIGGVILVLMYPWLRNWWTYDILTPLCLMVGVALLTYVRYLREERSLPGGAPAGSAASRRVAWVLCGVVVGGCAFWAAATLAEWSGRGEAVVLAERFRDLPSVIVDTKERLYVRDPVIQETVLPAEGGQTFRYRYRSLRLLIEGGERLFLVPDVWSTSGTVLVIPMNDSVRVQFQFQNPGD